jgi:serine/threonine-protein kinase
MTADRWRRLEELFESALALPPAERDSYVSATGDLAGDLRALLAAHFRTGSLLDRAEIPEAALPPGARVGVYAIVREIGAGGSGTVYLARRADGRFHLEVAIKFLDAPRLPRSVQARLQREQQILAQLDHPHIARILDAAVADAATPCPGVPYIVMEYVDGIPLTAFAAQERLPVLRRIELFEKLLAAVHYAHQHLVIHRDLKPANILVKREGSLKLLDFGTAKLLEAAAPDPGLTGAHVALTPRYASPEQMRGQAVSVASDIYSLGVVLFELLSGRLPYRDSEPLPAAILDSPRLPLRATPGGERLAPDLECIVAKALRKDPGARYANVREFAADLERFRTGRPVAAQRDSLTYRAGKFVKRHRWGVAAAAAVPLLLVAGVGAIVAQSRVAERERAKAQAVSDFLLEIISSANPSRRGPMEGKPADLRLVDLLDASAERVTERFGADPGIEVRLRSELASAYTGLQEIAKAKTQSGEALALARKVFGDGSPEAAEAYHRLGQAGVAAAEYAAAERDLRAALARFSAGAPPRTLASARNSLALAILNQGRPREALPLLERAFEEQRTSGATASDLGLAANNIATVHYQLNDRARFREWLDRSLKLYRTVAEPPFPFGSTLNNAAQAAFQDRDYGRAIALMDEAVAFWRRQLGGHPHADLATALANSAIMRTTAGRAGEARPRAAEALAIYLNLFPRDHVNAAHGLYASGMAACRAGDLTAGERDLREALAVRRKQLPAGDARIGSALVQLGICVAAGGRLDEAEDLLVEGCRLRRKTFGGDDAAAREAWAALRGLLIRQGRPASEAAIAALVR